LTGQTGCPIMEAQYGMRIIPVINLKIKNKNGDVLLQPTISDELFRMKEFFYETLVFYGDFIREWGNLKEEAWGSYIKKENREMIMKIGKLSYNQKMSLLGGMELANRMFQNRIELLYIAARNCQDLCNSYTRELEMIKFNYAIDPSYDRIYFDKGVDMARIAFFEVCIPYLKKIREMQ
jgi:hypothetical protein